MTIPNRKQLTDTKCRNAKPAERPYKLTDAKGLYLEVRPSGAKLWRYRYRIGGKENLFALGEYAIVPKGETDGDARRRKEGGRFTLEEARQERIKARAHVKQGLHPSHIRSSQNMARLEANANTFEAVANEWLTTKKVEWAPSRTRQVERIFAREVFPQIGRLPIDSVTAQQMLTIANRVVKRGAPTIAQIAWNTSGKVFALAKKTGRLKVSPISDMNDVIPRTPVKHHPPLTRKQIPQLVNGLATYVGERQTVIAMQLLMLTFVRSNELLGAEWPEFDLDAAEWRIPGSRMKMREDHIVPLSSQAVALLGELHDLTGSGKHVFPNRQHPRKFMARSTLHRALCVIGFAGKFSPHGFRATASTMLNELAYRPDVIERQLAHCERNDVRGAYNRAEYLPERRVMMQQYADMIDALAQDEKVIPSKRRR